MRSGRVSGSCSTSGTSIEDLKIALDNNKFIAAILMALKSL
jgi:hypothetical protein